MIGVIPTPPPLAEGKGRIYFYQLAKLWEASLFPRIRLDGTAIGKPIPGRFFFKDVDPGTYEISIRTEVVRRFVLRIAAGQTQYVRISLRFGWLIGRFRLESAAPEAARMEMRGLMLAGA